MLHKPDLYPSTWASVFPVVNGFGVIMRHQLEEFALVLSLSGSGYSDPKLLRFRVQGLCEEDKRDSLMVGQFTPACSVLSLARRAQASVSGCCPWLYLNVPGVGGGGCIK